MRIPQTLRVATIATIVTIAAAGGAVALPVVAIDPGHGGGDSGAVGVLPPGTLTGLTPRLSAQFLPVLLEKDVNLDVAQRVDAWLVARGFPTVLTRTQDLAGGDLPFTTVRDDLAARVDLANLRPAEIFVAIHQNSTTVDTATATGTETYVRRGAPTPTRLLATTIQQRLVACLGLADRGVREADFTVIKDTTMPAVLVEGAFLSSATDVLMLADPAFRQKMAEAIGAGVFQYAGLGDPGPVCDGAPVPQVPAAITLARAGRALTVRAKIDPTRGDLWIATVRDQAGVVISGVPLRARLPNGKGVVINTRPDGKALFAVPRRRGNFTVAVAVPDVKLAVTKSVPERVR